MKEFSLHHFFSPFLTPTTIAMITHAHIKIIIHHADIVLPLYLDACHSRVTSTASLAETYSFKVFVCFLEICRHNLHIVVDSVQNSPLHSQAVEPLTLSKTRHSSSPSLSQETRAPWRFHSAVQFAGRLHEFPDWHTRFRKPYINHNQEVIPYLSHRPSQPCDRCRPTASVWSTPVYISQQT